MRAILVSFLPLVLGCATVLQMGINQKIMRAWSLPAAVFFNSALLVTLAGLFYAISVARTTTSPIEFKSFQIWFLLPGLFGFLIVMAGPWAVSRLGAVQTFVSIVCAQLVTSMLWDWKVEAIAPTVQRGVGVALAIGGTLLACLR